VRAGHGCNAGTFVGKSALRVWNTMRSGAAVTSRKEQVSAGAGRQLGMGNPEKLKKVARALERLEEEVDRLAGDWEVQAQGRFRGRPLWTNRCRHRDLEGGEEGGEGEQEACRANQAASQMER